jgi:hypothetical protein
MKYLYILILLILGFNAMAQEPSYTPMRNNYLFRGVRIDSLFLIPHFSDTTTANVNLNSINGNLIRIDSLVYMRWNGAWISLAGGGGSQSLQDVTDVGNSTTNNISLLNSGIILDNSSRLQKGTIDAGYGGNNGIALICGLGYEMKWEAGRLYIMNGNGNAIRETRYNFTDTPTVADDITKGYYSGSRWILDNGTLYTCSDNTTNNAVWSITKDAYVDSIYRIPGVDSFYYTKQGNTYSVKDSVGSTDTTSLSNRINLKLSISDTSSMLSPYARTSAVNLKVNISDTSTMLSTYLRKVDTANHWVNNITRTLGKDSIIYYIGSTRYAIKDSTGGAGQNGRFGNDTATIVMAKVHNDAGSTLTNGEVVYLATSGTNSEAPAVKRANNKADSTSANTFGFVSGSISNNDTGYIILSGKIEKLNTAAFSNGDIIYLDSISGKWTKSKPKAPYHLVYLGVVIKSNAGNGSIFVKCQNGYELDEIHDVQINSISNNQIIVYSDTQKVWKNRSAYSVIDTTKLSNRINLKLSISDTASMLSSFVHYQDTASLSNRINAKQNTLTNPVTGTGTTGAISKFTGTSTIGDATVDVDYLQQDMSLVAYQAMGSSIKGYNLCVPNIFQINTSYITISSGLFLLYPIYIPKTTTITGVRWFQTVQGGYTASNYNGVALYSVSGGTLTRVDSSANDGNIWKATANTWVSKAFSNTYSAAAGIYYIGMAFSASVITNTPGFGASGTSINAITKSFDFTNSLKLTFFQSAVTTLPSTITASATSASSNNVALYLY